MEESDRLPKVICQQCTQHLDTYSEFRNVCRNAQIMLTSCLESSQNGGKVLVKDVLGLSSKHLNAINNVSNSITIQQQQQPSLNMPTTSLGATQAQQHQVFSVQGTNLMSQSANTSSGTMQNQDILNSIMQAVGIQVIQINHLDIWYI